MTSPLSLSSSSMTAVGPRLCPLYYSRHVGSLPSRFRPYVVNLLGRPWPPRQARSQQNIDINPSRHHLQTLPQTIPYCHPLCPISNFSKVRINRHIHHPRTVTGYSILLRYSIFSLKKKNSADPNRIFSFTNGVVIDYSIQLIKLLHRNLMSSIKKKLFL